MSGSAQAAESHGDWKGAEAYLRELFEVDARGSGYARAPGPDRCSRKARLTRPTRS